jgi:RIO-like serine/threonine protein kinase
MKPTKSMRRRMTMNLDNLQEPGSFIEVSKTIGRGAYGMVYKGKIKNTGQIVAVKTVRARSSCSLFGRSLHGTRDPSPALVSVSIVAQL